MQKVVISEAFSVTRGTLCFSDAISAIFASVIIDWAAIGDFAFACLFSDAAEAPVGNV